MEQLQAIYDARQSFYGKAKTETVRNTYQQVCNLFSYNTLVATIIYNFNDMTILYKSLGKFSQTTTRHQKEFFKQHNLNDKEIKNLLNKGELIKGVNE